MSVKINVTNTTNPDGSVVTNVAVEVPSGVGVTVNQPPPTIQPMDATGDNPNVVGTGGKEKP